MNIIQNKILATKGLSISEDEVVAIQDCVIILDRDFFDSCETTTSTIIMPANFDLYVADEEKEDTYYVFPFNLDFPLKINFDLAIESSTEVRLEINKGTTILNENFYRNDVNVAYQFFVKLMSGKYNDNAKLSYVDLLQSIKNVLSENEIKGHSSLEFEILLQHLCKASKDGETPFRHLAKATSKHTEFNMINIRDVPRFESAFNAIASENINVGIMKTLIKESNINILSPLERIALSKR